MRLRLAAVLLVLGLLGLVLWRAELFTVAKSGDAPRALALTSHLAPPEFDVSLPMVPVGVARLRPADGPLLVHYWAPWERNSRVQITTLDSLMRLLPAGTVRLAVVTFDPFPSVARYIGRLRVRTPVMLDLRRELQAALPCPSIPYTWLLDERGHVLAAQAGEVDWLAPATRELLITARRGGPVDSTALAVLDRVPTRNPGRESDRGR